MDTKKQYVENLSTDWIKTILKCRLLFPPLHLRGKLLLTLTCERAEHHSEFLKLLSLSGKGEEVKKNKLMPKLRESVEKRLTRSETKQYIITKCVIYHEDKNKDLHEIITLNRDVLLIKAFKKAPISTEKIKCGARRHTTHTQISLL